MDKIKQRLGRITELNDYELDALRGWILDASDGRDKVIRERIYVMDGWEAPQWRAPWRRRPPLTRHSDSCPKAHRQAWHRSGAHPPAA